jgi:diacylglycerol kinase family enzyme
MDPSERPGIERRAAAVSALLAVLVVVVASPINIANDARHSLVILLSLAAALFGAWYAITRVGGRRGIGISVAVAASVAMIVAAFMGGDRVVLSAAARVVLLLAAAWLGRFAIGRDPRSLKERETPGLPVSAATHGALIMNLKSGGGKAERFHLADECRTRGIEPIVLGPDDDLVRLARDAIDRGADVIGMAGGDGSQALVARVASERDVPMVVVPAGTRNHLALDLGLDRDDVVGALDAFHEADERPMDLAEVNGRVFVNNVSLGVYAAIVRSPDYRDAKLDTTLSTLPTVLGPHTQPFDLQFTSPDGEHHDGAHLIQVSNNPYGVRRVDSRPRLDTGQLGVITLMIEGDRSASAFLSAVATGHPNKFSGFTSWTSPTFEVDSGGPVDIGLDGEAISMDPPLAFTIREHALRVRLPRDAIGYSPAARSMGWRDGARAVVRVASGRPAAIDA